MSDVEQWALPGVPVMIENSPTPVVDAGYWHGVWLEQEAWLNAALSAGAAHPCTVVTVDATMCRQEAEFNAAVYSDPDQLTIWDETNARLAAHYAARAESEPIGRDYKGPRDPVHDRVHDVIGDILGGKVSKPARDAVGKALEKADAPPVGRAKADQSLGRAIRLTPLGLTGR